ncbi:plasmepsin V-like isoform X2 [Hylaeus volcanicus]|nr:plasmepsin V-like isoform X2 [Hylaeus volcanicus]XP_053991148.1 plasmepsin V-like isoform X2 [Hylaeus volcanicus]
MYFALIFGIFLSQNLYQCISAIINHSLQKKKPKRAFPLEWFRQYYISLINNSNVQNNPLRNLGDSTKIPISIPFFTDSASNTFFYTFILVGSPPQLQTVILDTGSSILGFPCSFCTQCGIHDLPSFKAWSSNSSYYISCTSPQCFQKDCSVTEPTEMCRYYQGYVEGSSIEGFYFSDIISFGMMSQHSPSIRYDYIGCHTQETHLFKTQTANGIVGLSSPTVPEQPYFIEKIIHRIPNSKKIFAMCGADQGGMLQLGGYNASYHLPRGLSSNSNLSGHTTLTLTTPAEDFLDTVGMNNAQDSSIMWTPNLSYRGFSIEIRRIELLLKNISVDIPITKECSLDSGSTYTSFPLHIITALKSFITNSCTNSTEPPCNTQLTFKENGLCWSNLSIEETDKLFPTLLLILP